MSRMAMFVAGLPSTVPIYAVNRQCASGLQAIACIAASIDRCALCLAFSSSRSHLYMHVIQLCLSISIHVSFIFLFNSSILVRFHLLQQPHPILNILLSFSSISLHSTYTILPWCSCPLHGNFSHLHQSLHISSHCTIWMYRIVP